MASSDDQYKKPSSMKGKPEVVDLTVNEDDSEEDQKPAALPLGRSVRSSSGSVAASLLTDSKWEPQETLPTKRISIGEATSSSTQQITAAAAMAFAVQNDEEDLFTCQICLSDIEDVKNQTYTLKKCGHRFCFVCLEQLVQTSSTIGSATAQPIPCPMAPITQDHCSESLTHTDIQSILLYSPKTLSMYTEASSMAFVEDQVAQGKARRCPNNHCNFTFEYEFIPEKKVQDEPLPPASAAKTKPRKKTQNSGGKKKKETTNVHDDYPNGCYFCCPECNSSYCLDCGANKGKVGPPHKGQSCRQRITELETMEEKRQQLEEWKSMNSQADDRFHALLKRETKRGRTKCCPKCKRLITKDGGCNHMYCIKCKKRFDWSSAPRYQPPTSVVSGVGGGGSSKKKANTTTGKRKDPPPPPPPRAATAVAAPSKKKSKTKTTNTLQKFASAAVGAIKKATGKKN